MSSTFPHLFSPLELGARTLPNRIALPATLTNFGAGNRVTPRWKDFLVERARGGCALLVSEKRGHATFLRKVACPLFPLSPWRPS